MKNLLICNYRDNIKKNEYYFQNHTITILFTTTMKIIFFLFLLINIIYSTRILTEDEKNKLQIMSDLEKIIFANSLTDEEKQELVNSGQFTNDEINIINSAYKTNEVNNNDNVDDNLKVVYTNIDKNYYTNKNSTNQITTPNQTPTTPTRPRVLDSSEISESSYTTPIFFTIFLFSIYLI